VLLERCVELLAPALEKEGAVFVDATLGMGGHSEAFLERFPGIHLVGLDRDQDALRIAGERLAAYADRITLVHTVYDGIEAALESAGFAAADGILFDLGVSSLQLDVADRGFAYSQDAPLDMRMDQTTGPMASYILETYSEGELRRIFERYGEEKLSGRYARAIIKARESAPIERSGQLVDILIAATPYAAQRTGHPAKRVFQALRIEGNRLIARVQTGGTLLPNKGINLPDTPLTVPALTERDHAALTVAAAAGVDCWRCRSCAGRERPRNCAPPPGSMV
jgi:16S rRNA (cytosine1402-N4)-methyltransferase